MSVKTSQSGARMLAVLEAIAAQQPIGASALARHLDADKSAVQRSLVTLAQAGWIVATDEKPLRWELSARLFTIANLPHSSEDLRRRANPALDSLRDTTGETVFLAVPDLDRFTIIDVFESRNLLRSGLRIGEIIHVQRTATGRAMLAHMTTAQREELLGRPPTQSENAEFSACRARGYGVSVGEIVQGATNIAAPVLDGHGKPIAAIGISGPSERIAGDRIDELGRALAETAQQLSRSRTRDRN